MPVPISSNKKPRADPKTGIALISLINSAMPVVVSEMAVARLCMSVTTLEIDPPVLSSLRESIRPVPIISVASAAPAERIPNWPEKVEAAAAAEPAKVSVN